jgi:hypothetical protein
LLDLPEPPQGVRRAAALFEPRVDRDSGPVGGVLDRLEQRQCDCDFVAERRVLGVAERDKEQIGGDEGRALGVGEPDCGV